MLERIFGKILFTFAHSIYDFYEYIYILINNMIPGLSRELLPEWEKDLGLPDTCSNTASSIEERANIAHTKYTTKYTGMSAQFYIDYAASLGSVIKVYNYVGSGQPFRVDNNRVDRTPTQGIDGARLFSIGSTFKWVVEIQKDDPNKNYLHCRFLQIGPAHLELVWIEKDIL